MKRIAIYYRVSTDRQDLASQEETIEDWLARLPPEQKPERITIYKDTGISGKISNRPSYQQMLQAAYSRQIDTIVCYRLDRISRSAKEAIHTLLSLDEIGVSFISVTQPVLNIGPENPFRRTMLAAFAELAEIERTTIVERVRAGLDAAKERGVQLGAPKKTDAATLATIRALRAEGKSLRQVAVATGLSYGTVQTLSKADLQSNLSEQS